MRGPLLIGPLALDVHAEAPWDAALDALLTSYRPGAASSGGPSMSQPVTLALRLLPPVDALPKTKLPRFVGDDQLLGDRSEAWEARVDRAAQSATFWLHDGKPEAHVRRELVASALRVTLATLAPERGGLLVHGAAAVHDGRALVFIGPSGEGKTTLARRLRAAGWTTLCDDAALITPTTVAATPLRGKEDDARVGGSFPLRGLVFLEKGAPTLALTHLTAAEATARLMPRVFWYASAPTWEARLLATVSAIVERVPAYRLASSLDHDPIPALAAL